MTWPQPGRSVDCRLLISTDWPLFGSGPQLAPQTLLKSVYASGPVQSKPICLLDRPLRSHLNPNASALSTVAFPQVATPPGPVSQPPALCTCTRFPGGVVGPPKASALDFNLPGISAC